MINLEVGAEYRIETRNAIWYLAKLNSFTAHVLTVTWYTVKRVRGKLERELEIELIDRRDIVSMRGLK